MVDDARTAEATPGASKKQHTVVMKFGGSSVADAEQNERSRQHRPVVSRGDAVLVLVAMGKSTNNLLLCGEESLKCENAEDVSLMKPLLFVKTLRGNYGHFECGQRS